MKNENSRIRRGEKNEENTFSSYIQPCMLEFFVPSWICISSKARGEVEKRKDGTKRDSKLSSI